jgi:hypothetical protein
MRPIDPYAPSQESTIGRTPYADGGPDCMHKLLLMGFEPLIEIGGHWRLSCRKNSRFPPGLARA